MSLLKIGLVSDDARLLFSMMGGGHALFIPNDSPNNAEIITWDTGETFPVSLVSLEELLSIGVITEWSNRDRSDWLSGWSEHNLPGDRGRLFRCTQ